MLVFFVCMVKSLHAEYEGILDTWAFQLENKSLALLRHRATEGTYICMRFRSTLIRGFPVVGPHSGISEKASFNTAILVNGVCRLSEIPKYSEEAGSNSQSDEL
jgi:hypothetical protein